jgi:hypothetical protein
VDSTRVVGPSGTPYRLFIRDILPFEAPDGTLPADTF